MALERDPQIDSQFTLDMIDDLPALFARRERAAEQARADYAGRYLAYGPGSDHRLTVYPAHRPDAPAFVFIHGGFWKSLDAALFAFLAPGFVPAGATLVLVDYPKMPHSRMASLVEASLAAVARVQQDSAAIGVDPARILVGGNSAGGHLAAEVMLRHNGTPLAGTVAISGLYDLAPVARSFQNDDLALTAEEVAAFSPITRTSTVVPPPLVAVGGREAVEFLNQSDAFARACGTTATVVPDTDHITILLDALAVPGHSLNVEVLRRLKRS